MNNTIPTSAKEWAASMPVVTGFSEWSPIHGDSVVDGIRCEGSNPRLGELSIWANVKPEDAEEGPEVLFCLYRGDSVDAELSGDSLDSILGRMWTLK